MSRGACVCLPVCRYVCVCVFMCDEGMKNGKY